MKEGLDVVSGIVQLFDNVLILQNQVLTEQWSNDIIIQWNMYIEE